MSWVFISTMMKEKTPTSILALVKVKMLLRMAIVTMIPITMKRPKTTMMWTNKIRKGSSIHHLVIHKRR